MSVRQVLRACALALALVAAPAGAQQTLNAEQRAALDNIFRGPVTAALDLCVSTRADPARVEADAIAAGWPAFSDVGQGPGHWRSSSIPPGERVLLSMGIRSGPINGAPAPTTALGCKLIVPTPIFEILQPYLRTKFPTEDGAGLFFLENGAVRALTLDEAMAAEFPALLGTVRADQRLVIVSVAQSGQATVVDIGVFHPAQ
ncbi:MAG: hypothetical protein AB7Q23_04835 [Hyphomonadaceae bacterium]